MAKVNENIVLLRVFLVSFVVIIPTLHAVDNFVPLDGYWKQRAVEARKASLDAYDPHPEKITSDLNFHVNKCVGFSISLRTMQIKLSSYNIQSDIYNYFSYKY